ncbi:kinase-like domain-containing protein [Aspergillus pseudonomiae]|uniref:Kinase-like domain-containing protein n=1 Tax=Aspergillus pseudonomiae TaxID=1506151 RepID=A0A5N7DQX1_9EURO|nr:kinase-like domain-containing protein [Aspergillus pseudonomiae]KAB8263056.1 kinase-like domain-containing protein [Aspergillus pseudonomiae]KAE8408695.1 kinase-like domain-containing protein [Aspergillus pseudonomiae]
MLSWLPRSLPRFLGRAWKPLNFANPNFGRISPTQALEEETLPDYAALRYYPTRIGEVIKDRYQVVGKLRYGATSTVWLARDMNSCSYVTLKIFIKAASMGHQLDGELKMYQRIDRPSKHPGRNAIRSLLDSFHIDGPEDKHQCLVHPPLFESVWEFLHRNPVQRLPKPVLAFTLRRVFLALDYLHTECQIIHTDIKANNIMFELADDSVFIKFEQDELHNPSPRKELDGRAIYLSRDLQMIPGKLGAPVLCDFGSAMLGGVEHLEDVQPDIYRAPEVILEIPWSYSIDIWNVGCMIWNIFEGGSLFTGHDPEFQKYRSRAHLAEMINLLGPPPPGLLTQGKQSHKFFSDTGEFHEPTLLQNLTPLEQRETTLEGEDKESFLRMMRRMLQWEPEKRSPAKELAEDEWILKQIGL